MNNEMKDLLITKFLKTFEYFFRLNGFRIAGICLCFIRFIRSRNLQRLILHYTQCEIFFRGMLYECFRAFSENSMLKRCVMITANNGFLVYSIDIHNP